MGLAYERHGSGAPLVLVHGIGHRRQAWYPVLDRLTPYREVILVDLPGHGESPAFELNGLPVPAALERDLINFMDELGLDRPHVAGNSLGGRLALEAGVRGRASTVTTLSPAGFWRDQKDLDYTKFVFRSMQVLGKQLLNIGLDETLARFAAGRFLLYATIIDKPSRMSVTQAEGDIRAFVAAEEALTTILAGATEFHGTIAEDVPVTVAWGTRDRLLRPHQAEAAKRALLDAWHLPLPGCGHVPMTDDPELVANVLLRGSSLNLRRRVPAQRRSPVRR